MKNIFKTISANCLLLAIIFPNQLKAQGVEITSGGIIMISGESTILISNGNFVNNGTYIKGNETVTLSGTSPAVILTDGSIHINDLLINNTGGVTAKSNQLTVNNLTIATGSKLTIDTTRSVTVTNELSNNAGAAGIIIKANRTAANGSLIFFGTPPLATVEMYSNSSWVMVGSTRTNLKWQFFGIPIQSLSNVSPTFDGAYVRRYNEAGNGSGLSATNRWVQLQNGSAMQHTNGYEVVQASAKTYMFKGQLFNGEINRALSFTPTADFPGQHILANPYTAAIDIKKIQFGDDVEKSVYQYNTGSYDDWYNNSGGSAAGNSPGQYILSTVFTAGDYGIPAQIPSMQGYMVKVNNDSENATISIPYSAVAIKNNELQRAKAETIEKVYTVIDVIGSRYSDRMWVYTNPDCTREFDNGWDGRKISNLTPSPQIFAMEKDGNYQINAVDNVDNTELGFKAGEDVNYTIQFKHVNTESVYQSLYLIDLENNTVVDITEDNSFYSFTAYQTPNPVKRFKIATSPCVTTGIETANNSLLNVFNSGSSLFIDNKTPTAGKLYVYDLAGQLIKEATFERRSITTLNANLATGNYIVKAITNRVEQTRKILIN